MRRRRTFAPVLLALLASCQVLSGLDDLTPAPAPTSSSATGGNDGSGGNGAGGGNGGEGEGGEEMCEETPAQAPCIEMMDMECAGSCLLGADGPCNVLCDGNSNHRGCDLNSDAITQCGPPNYDTSCVITCGGSCQPKIRCPIEGDLGCTVECITPGSCFDRTIQCGDGPCVVACEMGACNDTTTVVCGPGRCDVSCGGAAVNITYGYAACETNEESCL